MKGWTLHVLAHGWAFDERDGGAVAGECVEGFLGVAADDGDFDLGVFCEEACDEAGQQVLADGL